VHEWAQFQGLGGVNVRCGGVRVQGLRFIVKSLGIRVEELCFGVHSERVKAINSGGIRIQGSESRVWFLWCKGSDAGSYLRLIDFCITQL